MPKLQLFSRLRKLIISVLALMSFLVVVLFAIYAYLQNNPSRLEVVLETVVTRLLGREFQIGELLESDLGPESYLLARDVSLENPAWAKDADLVRAGHLMVRINLPSIWQDGPILIRQLELEDVSVNLLAAQENPANWDFWPQAQQSAESDDRPTSTTQPQPVFPLRILTGSVARGVVTFHSSSQDIDLSIGDLALSEQSEGGLINLNLNGVINDIPLKVNGRLGPTAALLSQRDVRTELSIQMGELLLRFKGSIEDLSTFSGPDLQVEISSPRSQPFLELMGIGETADGPFDFKGRLTDAHPGIALQASGSLNGIEVELTAEVADRLKYTGLQLGLELQGPSVSELGAMLGFSGLPDAPYDIKGKVESTSHGIELLDFQFHGPLSRIVLGGKLGASPDFLGAHLTMEISGESQAAFGPWLDIHFLPVSEFKLTGTLDRVDSGWELSEAVFSSDELQIKVDASVDQLPQPASLNAQLELSSANIASLLTTYGVEAEGVPALPIAIHAQFSGAPTSLTIDQLTVQSGESRLKASGLLGDLATRENIDLAVELNTPNLKKFLPPKPEGNVLALPLDVRGHVIVTADGVGVKELSGTLRESSIALQGNLNLLPPLENSKFALQVEGPNLGAVLNPWLERDVSEVPFQLAMEADFSAGGLKLSRLKATVEDARLSGEITIADLNNPASARGNFTLEGPSSWQLVKLFDSEAVFPDSKYTVKVGVKNSGDWLQINPITVQWGRSDLSGSVNIRPGNVLSVEADLRSKFLDMPFLVPSINAIEEANAEGQEGAAESKELISDELTKEELGDRIIPDMPLDFSSLKQLQGSFKFRADNIYVNDKSQSSTELDFTLKDGVLASRKIHWDGTFIRGDAVLSLRALEKSGEIDVRLRATRLPLFIMLGGEEEYAPNGVYKGNLKLSGGTWRELAKSANGALIFHAGGGKIDNRGGNLILGDVVDQVFSRLNPVKETELYTHIICHAGALSVTDGKVSLVPGVVMRTRELDLAMGGAIDLHNEKIDLVFSTRSRKGLGVSASKAITPYFKLGGTMAYPQLVLDPKGIAVSGGVAVATAGVSILAEGLWDRWVATASNPCDQLIEQLPEQEKENFRKLLSPVPADATIN